MEQQLKPWTVFLLLLVLFDSLYTSYMVNIGYGKEYNPMILYIMETFNLSIDTAMVIRLLFYLPLIYITDRYIHNYIYFL